METSYLLKDGDRLDVICFDHYGFVHGALEQLLEANADKLTFFDDLGVFYIGSELVKIVLPEIERPTDISTVERLFD